MDRTNKENLNALPSLFDLHVHTNQGSPDSALTPEEMVSEVKRLGLTGAMVTEHDGWPEFEFSNAPQRRRRREGSTRK